MGAALKSWRIMDYGEVPSPPSPVQVVEFTCLNCMNDSLLPVVGRALAQCEQGIVFDTGHHAMPRLVQCRHCRRKLEVANVR